MIVKLQNATKSHATLEVTLSEPRPSASQKTTLLATSSSESIDLNGTPTRVQLNVYTKNEVKGKLPKTILIKVPLQAPAPSSSGKTNLVGKFNDLVPVGDVQAKVQVNLMQKIS